MRICLICSEFLGWGSAGGYGFATRSIGRALVRRGHEVFAVVPQPRGKTETALEIDGIQIRSHPRPNFAAARDLFRACDADIYHSQEPSLSTYLAMRAVPHRPHVVASRDPRVLSDWLTELRYPTFSRLRLSLALSYYENPLTYLAVRRSAGVYVPAKCLAEKVRRKYLLAEPPGFLPTPIHVPDRVDKAPRPTVCYVGRLDRRKRPERFLDLARAFTGVHFVVVGGSQDSEFDRWLRTEYGDLDNLEFLGFVDQFTDTRLSDLLGRSWVMVNTAAREGLPNSFIEAAAHRCAIVSALDPDGFASGFGAVAADDDFAGALGQLLENDRWREQGERGHAYVRETNATDRAIDRHLEVYQRHVVDRAPRRAA